ncbi:MAG: PEP-CTERM system TPR-repeat protein PrsT [Burkholderiaceae bacterium]|nr:PEP-CTERM system TPR-repeat protein PrsT [Burkholderiaceae bacterium]
MKRYASHHPLRHAVAAAILAFSLAACADSPESLLVKAKDSLAKNETKAAEIHLKNLLQKQDIAEARYLLGKIYLESGDSRSAEKELQRALDGGFDHGTVAPALASALMQLGSFQKVLDQAAKATPEQPEERARLLTAAGRAHIALGKPDAARASFESALAAKTSYAPAQVGLIALQASRGDIPGASAQVDKVLAEQPGSAEALALKGDLELAQGRRKEARELFVKAARADAQDRPSRAKIAAIDIELKDFDSAQKSVDDLKRITGPAAATMQLQATLYARQGKFEPARDAIQQALKVAPDYLPSLALGAQVHLALNSIDQAESYAKRVLDAAPNSSLGYRLLAGVHIRRNSPEKALALVEPVLQRGAKDPAIWALAGEAALRSNEPKKAEKYFEQATKLDPKNPLNKTGLAMSHLAQGDKTRGIAELELASDMSDSAVQADLALVMTYLRERNYDKALAAVGEIEKKQPTSAIAANLRGSVLTAKGDVAGARKAFENAIERDPKFLPAVANLASLDLREKKVESAKKRYVAFLATDPKNVRAMLALAQIAQGSAAIEHAEKRAADLKAGRTPSAPAPGASNEALDWLKKAREADKSSVPAALALASWYLGNGQEKDAVPLLQEALAAAPDNIQLLDALGTAYMRTDQPVQAMGAFEKILRVKPDSAQLHLRMGQLKLSRGDTVGAMQNLRRAVELDPKALEARATMAAAHVRAGKPEEARKIAAAIQKEQPKNPLGFVLDGDIAMSERRFGDAAGSFRKALAIDKALPISLKLHRATYAAGGMADADKQLQALLKDSPDNLQLRMYAGEVEISRKRWAEAVANYEVVLAQQPGNALALNNAAWALHELKDPKALGYADKAAAAAPQAPAVLDTLGVILTQTSDAARAVQVLKKAVSLAPKATQFRLHLAEALIKAGDREGARQELDALLSEAPEGPLSERVRELKKQI